MSSSFRLFAFQSVIVLRSALGHVDKDCTSSEVNDLYVAYVYRKAVSELLKGN